MARTMTRPLADAHDSLSDRVSQFHNDMLRQGVREMSPREWVENFCGWLDAYEFERQYKETLKWLETLPAAPVAAEGGR